MLVKALGEGSVGGGTASKFPQVVVRVVRLRTSVLCRLSAGGLTWAPPYFLCCYFLCQERVIRFKPHSKGSGEAFLEIACLSRICNSAMLF